MFPVKFPESNRKLLPSGKEYSLAIESIEPLHTLTDGEQSISCWQLTEAERDAVANGAKVFLHVLSGESQPPVAISVGDSVMNLIRE